MNDPTTPDEPQAEPSVGELLLDEIDSTCRRITLEIDRLERLTRQLHPERAESCLTTIAMARVMVTEIEDRAHAQPT